MADDCNDPLYNLHFFNNRYTNRDFSSCVFTGIRKARPIGQTNPLCNGKLNRNSFDYLWTIRYSIFCDYAQIWDVNHPLTLAEVVHKAFRTAKMEKPGAVIVELPENLAAQEISDDAITIIPAPTLMSVDEEVIAAVDQINNSQRPFIIVGNGVFRAKAVTEVNAFIDCLQAPVIHRIHILLVRTYESIQKLTISIKTKITFV